MNFYRITKLLSIACVTFCTVIEPITAHSDDTCTPASQDQGIEKKEATASSWANVRNAEGSIRFESQRLLKKALDDLTAAKAPAQICGEACRPEPAPQLLFTSVPKSFLKDYSEAQTCAGFLKTTTAKPFVYSNRTFASADELTSWFSDFSQGSGVDGKDLYERCPGACSPQYTCIVHKEGETFKLNAEVICGHARDKDENAYKLATSYRWSCSKH